MKNGSNVLLSEKSPEVISDIDTCNTYKTDIHASITFEFSEKFQEKQNRAFQTKWFYLISVDLLC